MKITFKPTCLIRLWVFSCLLLSACQQNSPAPNRARVSSSPSKIISSPPPADASYLGLTPTAAIAKATQAGLRSRVIRVDGKSARITKDLRPSRLNFAITNGKVTRVTKG